MATSKKTATPKRLPNPSETRFMLRLPNEVHELLSKLAAEENRSLNNMVVELIKRAAKG